MVQEENLVVYLYDTIVLNTGGVEEFFSAGALAVSDRQKRLQNVMDESSAYRTSFFGPNQIFRPSLYTKHASASFETWMKLCALGVHSISTHDW